MRKIAVVAAALLSALTVVPAEAQTLQVGKWTGSVTPPDEPIATEVTYDVTLRGDTISITATAAEHGSFPLNDVKLTDGVLTFWFQPGPRVDCTLNRRDDGSFAGDCRDPDGGVAGMVMVPPKKD